jgi:sugar phosphate isomerase/epimerase
VVGINRNKICSFFKGTAVNRRDFLANASLSALAVAAGGLFSRSTIFAVPAYANIYAGNYKVSLNCYSFNTLLINFINGASPGMSLSEVIDFCAQHKFDAIDPQGYYFPGYPAVPTDAYIAGIKTQARDLGVAISGTGVNNNFASTNAQSRANDVQLVKNWIIVAAKLGAPVIRVFSGTMPAGYEQKWDEVAVWMADSIRECADYGKQNGVKVIVQNHADMLKTADQIIALNNLVNSDNFGLLLDTGSFVTTNLSNELAKTLPYATNFLLKQNVENDLPAVIQLARNANFQGYLLIEALSGDPLVVVPKYLSEVRNAISTTTGIGAAVRSTRVNPQFTARQIGTDHLLVSIPGMPTTTVSFALYDVRGRFVKRLFPVGQVAGTGRFHVGLGRIAAGEYYLGCFSGVRLVETIPVSVSR